MWSFKPTFKREKQFCNGAIATEKEKRRINLNKPIYVGTTILDLSKILMRDFHYNYIKNKYGDNAEMLLTDSDSLMYKIETENVYKDFYKNKKLFDISNYPRDSKGCNNSNNLVIGKMKDETCGMPLKGFVRLKSKMCTFKTEDNHESIKAKGI